MATCRSPVWIWTAVLLLWPNGTVPAQDGPDFVQQQRLRPHREPERALPTDAKIERAMDDILAVDFRETQLKDALEFIGALQNLTFQYDTDALRMERINMDQPITLTLKDFPLRILLKLLLEPVAMEWIIQDGAIVITTRSKAENQVSAWRYDVNDLIAAEIPADALASTVAAMVAPESWKSSGGQGSMEIDGDGLLVLQTGPVHRKLRSLLRQFRRHLTETGAARRARDRLFATKKYDVSNCVDAAVAPENLIKIVASAVFRSTWKQFGGHGTLELNGNTLEATNHQWVHNHLGRLLDWVDALGLEHGRNGSSYNFEGAVQLAGLLLADESGLTLDAPLDQPVTVAFQNDSLWHIVRVIHRNYGIFCNVTGEFGKTENKDATHVTLILKDVPLRSALDQLFAPLGLDWYVDDYPPITVVSTGDAAARRDPTVYRVKELVDSGCTATDLARQIMEMIEPQSWQPAGGTASIRALPGLLVIRHNRQTHERIGQLLEAKATPESE